MRNRPIGFGLLTRGEDDGQAEIIDNVKSLRQIDERVKTMLVVACVQRKMLGNVRPPHHHGLFEQINSNASEMDGRTVDRPAQTEDPPIDEEFIAGDVGEVDASEYNIPGLDWSSSRGGTDCTICGHAGYYARVHQPFLWLPFLWLPFLCESVDYTTSRKVHRKILSASMFFFRCAGTEFAMALER